MKSRLFFAPLVLGTLCFSLVSSAANVPGPQQLSPLEEAAWGALKATYAAQAADRADIEDVYRWSRRVKNAEIAAGKPAAAKDHFDRMGELHRKISALRNVGAVGGSEEKYFASKYFMLKAKADLDKPAAAK